MIVDTSAILAVLLGESDARRYASAIAASRCRIAASALLEASMVVESRGGEAAGDELDVFLERAAIEVVPVTELARAARRAWRRFGKGNHPAKLNFGDCFSYALAATTDEALLFKGEDFARTDIRPA